MDMVHGHAGDELTVGLGDLSGLSNQNDSMILSYTSMGVLANGLDLDPYGSCCWWSATRPLFQGKKSRVKRA